MEEFFPSEIARLVLGYLGEVKCHQSWHAFLKECNSLSEYYNLCQKGEVYSTKVNGKTLLEILKEYCSLKKKATDKVPVDKKNELENSIIVTKDVLEKIVEKAVAKALKQHLPPVCQDIDDMSDDNNDSPDDSDDSVTVISNAAEENGEDLNVNLISDNNATNVVIDAAYKNASCALSEISITDVASISVNELYCKEKGCSKKRKKDNFKESPVSFKFESASNSRASSVSSKTELSFSSSSITLKAESPTSCKTESASYSEASPVSPKAETVTLLDLKTEVDDAGVPVTNAISSIQKENAQKMDVPKNIENEDTKLSKSCSAAKEFNSKKSSTPRNKPDLLSECSLQPDIQEIAELNKPVNHPEIIQINSGNDLINVNNCDNCIENNESISFASLQSQNINNVFSSDSTLCVNNNLEATHNSSLNTQNLIVQGNNLINTYSSDQSAVIFATNSVPNQCGPFSNVPTYILPSYPSSSFVQNNIPYNIVLNTCNGIPVALSEVSADNSNAVISPSTSSASTVQIPPNVPSTTDELRNSTDSTEVRKTADSSKDQGTSSFIAKKKESAKRKNNEQLSQSKKNGQKESKGNKKVESSQKFMNLKLSSVINDKLIAVKNSKQAQKKQLSKEKSSKRISRSPKK